MKLKPFKWYQEKYALTGVWYLIPHIGSGSWPAYKNRHGEWKTSEGDPIEFPEKFMLMPHKDDGND